MYFAEFRENEVVFTEERGSNGAQFFYIIHRGKAVPLSQIGTEIDKGRSGGTKTVDIHIPAEKFGDERFVYLLGTSNSGYFHKRKYYFSLQNSELRSDEIEDWSPKELNFRALGDEETALELYKESVPPMVAEIKRVAEEYGFEFSISGKRTRATLENPLETLTSSMMFNSARSRSRSLNQRLQSAHEIFGLAILIDELDGQVTGGESNRLNLQNANEWPSGYIETDSGKKTIWYQFSIESQVDIVSEGVLRWFDGQPKAKERQYVRPDLLIADGEYEKADDLRNAMSEDILIVDMKHGRFAEKDVQQLSSYTERFPNEAKLLIGTLQNIPQKYEMPLEEIGWQIGRLSPGDTAQFRQLVSKITR